VQEDQNDFYYFQEQVFAIHSVEYLNELYFEQTGPNTDGNNKNIFVLF
jgi:hypothetical protein